MLAARRRVPSNCPVQRVPHLFKPLTQKLTMPDQFPPDRPRFRVSGLATVRHLNIRKEGPEDEKILAVDIKLEIKNVDRRLCAYFDDALEGFLWRGDTDALIARNICLAPVFYMNEISAATAKIGDQTFVSCDVKKFQLEARDGGVMTLTCSVCVYPGRNNIEKLAAFVQESVGVDIEGPPDLFDQTPGGAQ